MMMITGKELGILGCLMKADAIGRSAYEEMARAADFRHPMPYDAIQPENLDALLLPGGQAPGMKPYLASKSSCIQSLRRSFMPASRSVQSVTELRCARTRGAAASRFFMDGKRRVLPRSWSFQRESSGAFTFSTISKPIRQP